MPRGVSVKPAKADAKSKILAAALSVIRAKGYSATTVDDLCAAAGVTKGAFFHHFKSKEDLALAAAKHFSDMAEGLFGTASFRNLPDPVERLLAYVDFRKAILVGAPAEYTCLLGTMVQESFDTHPAIRAACRAGIHAHAHTLEADIKAAYKARGLRPKLSAKSLALYMQAVIQGAFILAKAWEDREVARDCLDHLKCYLGLIFSSPSPQPGAAA